MNRRAIIAGLALSLLACARFEEAPAPIYQTQELVFTAYDADEYDSTKTARQANTDVYWSPGDEISLFFRSGENGGSKFVAQNTEEVAITQFKGTIDVISGGGEDTGGEFWFWGIYPYSTENSCDGSSITTIIPAQQTGKAGTFADNTFITMARAKGLELGFYNICSGVKFTLSRSDIKEVRIRGNNNEDIAGKIKAEWDANGKPVIKEYVEGAKEVSVTAPGGGTFAASTDYYLVFAPELFTEGFTLTLITSDYQRGNFVYGNERQFKRGIFVTVPNLDTLVDSWTEASKAILPYNFLPNEVDKTTITEAYFHVSDPTTTTTIIGEGDSEYDPIFFEMIGTVAHFYTTAQVYKCYGINFEGWKSLRNLDLSMFDVSEVGAMSQAFKDCHSLQSLNLSSFDTHNVLYFSNMFNNCRELRELDITNFDTSKAISMYGMFNNCRNLRSLDVSGFNTSSVKDFGYMFENCINLAELDVSGFNLSSAESIPMMFANCLSLSTLDVHTWESSTITTMYGAFQGCKKVSSLNLAGLDLSNVVNMQRMFYGCQNLSELNLSKSRTGRLVTWGLNWIFADCQKLESLDLSNFDTSDVTDMSLIFFQCYNLESINFDGWDTSSVTNMSWMFLGCQSLKNIDLSRFNTGSVTNMNRLFSGCSKLQSLDLSNWDTSQVTDMSYMFEGCRKLERLNISSFTSENLQEVYNMFGYTHKLSAIDMGNFDMTNLSSGILYQIAKNSPQCYIRCLPQTKSVIEALNNPEDIAKIIWITDGTDMPSDISSREEGYYYSENFSKDKTIRFVQQASIGAGIDLVLMGDGYSDRMIDAGDYDLDMERTIDAIFSYEPFASFKNMFNIIIIYAVSDNEVIGKSTALSTYDNNRIGTVDSQAIFSYSQKASTKGDQREIATVVVMNSSVDDGIAYNFFTTSMDESGDYHSDLNWDDYHGGQTFAIVSNPNHAFYERVVIHEFGHSFGNLDDEYIHDDDDHAFIPEYRKNDLMYQFPYGLWKNIDLTDDPTTIKWKHFLSDARYTCSGTGVYEGGDLYKTGVWRPSENSIMRHHDSSGQFNAPSREAIYYRIHKLAFGKDWEYNFEDFVQWDLKNIQQAAPSSVPVKRIVSPTNTNRKHYFKMEESITEDGKKMITIIQN